MQRSNFKYLWVVAVAAGAFLSACGDNVAASSAAGVSEGVRTKIAEAFPNTKFNRIVLDKETGMVVGEAGQTVLYFSKDAKHVFVGDVMDLEARVNITERRRNELSQVASLEAKAFGKAGPSAPANAGAAAPQAPSAAPPARPSKIDVSSIAMENVVVKNRGAGKVVYVVSDYNCSFCSKLHTTLKGLEGIEIREIPVGFLRPDSSVKAAAVLCDDDPVAKAEQFFSGLGGTQITTCSDGEKRVEENSAWMSANGISGTPLMITEDGSVLNGAQPLPNIKAFLGIS